MTKRGIITAVLLIAACSSSARADEIGGLYIGSKLEYSHNWKTRSRESSQVSTILLFSRDGWVFWSNGRFGLLDEFDVVKTAKENSSSGGRWERSGDTLTIRYNDGKIWPVRVLSPSRLVLRSGLTLQRVMKVAPRLQGTYRNSRFTAVDHNGASVSSDHSIVFRKDGTVRTRDSLFVDLVAKAGSSDDMVAGTYSISGHTLKVTVDGETKLLTNIWGTDGSPDEPKMLTINGKRYLRQ